MPSLSEFHPELRARIPGKPYEFYNDALRWAIDKICRRTSMWVIVTTIITEADKEIYNLDLPTNTVTHSNLKIIQKGNTDRVITRPVNGVTQRISNAPSDYLQSFDTYSKNQVEIFPIPVNGGITLEIHTAIKPVKHATEINNAELFDEYADTVVYGALFRLFENDDPVSADRNEKKFYNGVSSIHNDVLKKKANTPMRLYVGW